MRILFSGGGTLGSVTPLLAVMSVLQEHKHELLFVGTAHGPERKLLRARNISFHHIVAPKFRRYFSLRHALVPLEFIVSIVQAARYLWKIRPDAIVTAGGYVAVPFGWVGWVLGIPLVIHQQDVRPGMTNIFLQKMSRAITVTFQESLVFFPRPKTTWIGNPVRNLQSTTHAFSLDRAVPTVLIMGGGTGAQALNDLVSEELCTFANIIHITGKGKTGPTIPHPRYHQIEFADEELKEAYHNAAFVVARAGLGTITELAALGKAAMLIPIPDSHQEENAKLVQRHNACVVGDQRTLTPRIFAATVHALLESPRRCEILSKNIHELMPSDAAERMVAIIEALA